MPQAQLNDGQSIYLQIAGMIEDNILRDILLEGEQAPSTNELARMYTINPATAAKGLNLLADAGILYKRRGLGMFVAEGAKNMIAQQRRDSFYEGYIRPLVEEARNIGLSAGEIEALVERAMQEGV